MKGPTERIKLPELTSEEKMKPYSKYYYREPAIPDAEVLKAIQPGKQMDPSKAISPDEINQLLNRDYLEVENGYCQMPDGTGYIAVLNKLPGIEAKMFLWYDMWKMKEDLRYKIWNPGSHMNIGPRWMIEDLGGGPIDVFLIGGGAENAGFDMEKYKKSSDIIIVGSAYIVPCCDPIEKIPVPCTICHVIRTVPEGIEFRTRFYLGCMLIDGKIQKALRPGMKIPEEDIYNLAEHCAWEFPNLCAILPQLFDEEQSKEPDVWAIVKSEFKY